MSIRQFMEIRELTKEVKRLDHEVDRHKREAQDADTKRRKHAQEAESLRRKLESSEKEVKKLKAIVRRQSGADLLVNALEALGVIPPPQPDPKLDPAFQRQDAILQQMRNAGVSSGMQGQQSMLNNLLGGAIQ